VDARRIAVQREIYKAHEADELGRGNNLNIFGLNQNPTAKMSILMLF